MSIYDGAVTVYYCEPDPCAEYEEGTQEKCECEGRYWWGDECHDEPEPEPDPDTCENWEQEGYESWEACRCENYGDNCPEEPSCEDQGLCDDGEGNCVECEPDPEEEGEPEE